MTVSRDAKKVGDLWARWGVRTELKSKVSTHAPASDVPTEAQVQALWICGQLHSPAPAGQPRHPL